jgi:tetratricopeptide (TPR) repeat protein
VYEVLYQRQGTANPASIADALDAVAKSSTGNNAEVFASLMAADNYYAAGMKLVFLDRLKANEQLESAVENYKNVIANVQIKDTAKRDLRNRAHFGLGRSYEGLSRLEDAEKAYQVVVAEDKDGVWYSVAEARRKLLKKPETARFYQFLASEAINAPKSPSSDFLPKMPGIGDLPKEPAPGLGDLKFAPPAGVTVSEPIDGKVETPATEEKPANEEATAAPEASTPAGESASAADGATAPAADNDTAPAVETAPAEGTTPAAETDANVGKTTEENAP